MVSNTPFALILAVADPYRSCFDFGYDTPVFYHDGTWNTT